jgi:pimeloyl-ACP methyl ester carboxylesterase
VPDVQIDGHRLHYREAGSGAGQRVLYIHGTGCHGGVWSRHMQVIAVGHTSVAIDLPGHGPSGGPGFRGVADHAHVAVALADHLGWDRFVLAGHSLGGGIAIAAALYWPERIRALMLIGTGGRLRVDPAILAGARRAAAGETVSEDPRRGFAAGTPDSLIEAVRAEVGDVDPAVTYRDWIADDSCDFLSRVASIAAPALALCGDEDVLTPPKYHEYLRDHMPNCQLEVLGGAGHWTFAEQPEAFDRAVLGFLDAL